MEKKYVKNNELDLMEYDVDETGAMIYVVDTEETHILNETAFFLFQLLEKPKSVEELYSHMNENYEFTENESLQVKLDISKCLDDLEQKSLVKLVV